VKKIKELCSSQTGHEIIFYLIFGVLTTLVSWVSYALLVEFTGLSVTVSNIISWIAAVTFAFGTNKVWVFRSPAWSPPSLVAKEAVTFVGSRILSGALEMAGLPFLYYVVGLDMPLFGVRGFAARVLLSGVVMVLNYVFSKWFVFKKKTD